MNEEIKKKPSPAPKDKPQTSQVKRIERILQSERTWDKVEKDMEKIFRIIQEDSFFQNPKMKDFTGNVNISLRKTTPDGKFYLETTEPVPLEKEKEIVIFKQVNGYQLELTFELISINEKSILCKPKEIRKGENLRRSERYSLKDTVVASHFLVAKVDMELESYLGYSTEVIFTEIQKDFQEKLPGLRLVYTYQSQEKTLEQTAIEQEERPIFLSDARTMQIAKGDYADIIEYYEMDDVFEKKKTQFFKENVSSVIYYPIYFRIAGKQQFIGYAFLQEFYPKRLDEKVLDIMAEISARISRTILDSHTIMIPDHQNILNYSKQGMLFEITNQKIADGISVKSSFSVDIVFKLHTPLRLAMVARNIYKIEDVYYVGAEIIGATNDPAGLEKYRENIQSK